MGLGAQVVIARHLCSPLNLMLSRRFYRDRLHIHKICGVDFMRGVAFEHISPSTAPADLPIQMRQTSSLAVSLGKLSIMLPTAALLLVPFALIGSHLIEEPAALSVFTERPGSVVQIVVGLMLWGILFGLPVRQLLKGLGRSRMVHIVDGMVHVTERSLAGHASWSEPLRNFKGLAHNVRTSVSAARHELILVHSNRELSVLVALADRFSSDDVMRIAAMLGQPEVPSSGLYRMPSPIGWRDAAPASPLSAAA